MRVFALGDLHLSFGRPKPMDIFGEEWSDHPSRIAAEWDRVVDDGDVVLVPGDVSWAHTAEEVAPDLQFVSERRGRLKVLLKGNHDSWWTGSTKVRSLLPDGLAILHNDALRLPEGVVLCGARGWTLPGTPWFDPERDARIYEREIRRLELSLESAQRVREQDDELVALLHYPPLAPGERCSDLLERLREAGVRLAVYGHLHGSEDHAWAPTGCFDGVELHFVASDFVRFVPQAIFDSRTGLTRASGSTRRARPAEWLSPPSPRLVL